MRGLQIVGVAALVTMVTAAGAAAETARPSHVRGLSPQGRELVAQAHERSGIVRTLIATLEASDVVVYVELGPVDRLNTFGYMSFLTAAGGIRYLVVRIDWLAIGPQRIVALGHELQHALEVATAPQVRNCREFALLYARIGWQTGAGRYETDLARHTGERVERELAGFRPAM